MKYIDKPYYNRQLLMVVEDDRGTANESIDVFRKNELPQGVNFGNSSVKKNELYIAHPFQKGMYIPYVNHEIAFFQDKMHELSILLQALGAEEIAISWVKGRRVQELENSSFNIAGGASAANKFAGSAEYSTRKHQENKDSSDESVMLKITSDPIHKPYVPENMSWYHAEPTWVRMVQQRMQGMKTYSLQISSKSNTESTSIDAESLKVALRVLFVKLKVQVEETLERIFKKDEETLWKVDVKFKPLASFIDEPKSEPVKRAKISERNTYDAKQARESYRNSCLKLIKNKDVSDAVAIELNRLRDKLNVPVEIAEQIEEEIKNSIKEPWYKRLFR